jgi:hypothetical protein
MSQIDSVASQIQAERKRLLDNLSRIGMLLSAGFLVMLRKLSQPAESHCAQCHGNAAETRPGIVRLPLSLQANSLA